MAKNDLRNQNIDRETAEERRRKKLERQEKRVERMNEPLFVWMHKSFRLVTVLAAIVLSLIEWQNGTAAGVDNVMQRVLFTAMGAWCTFGLVWFGAAVGQILSLKKNGVDEDDPKGIRYYATSAGIFLVGAVVLIVAFMMS